MTDTLNGELLYVFGVSIVDAAILSWIALRWYQRSVTGLMQPPAGGRDESPADSFAAGATAVTMAPLAVGIFAASRRPDRVDPPADPVARRRIVAAYIAGALAYSGVMMAAMALEMWPLPEAAIVSLLWVNAWPVLPALSALLVFDRVKILKALGAYVLCGAAAVGLVTLAGQVSRGAFSSAPVTNIFWACAQLVFTAYLPVSLLVIAGWRRIRAVVAIALAATLLFGLGLILFRRAFIQAFNVDAFRTFILDLAGFTTTEAAYYALYLLLALPVGWLVLQVMKWLAAAYERKAFSDIQLIVDCWFAIVTAESIAVHLTGPFGVPGIAIGLAAFAAYRISVAMVLRVLPSNADSSTARGRERLLLLRVFGYQSRTESLFDHLAQRWRFRGPVQLIVGSDLAMRTVDPGDVLAFVSGRLRNQYVSTLDEVADRVRRLDMKRDPDSRFRINELYCLHDTWQPTLQSLLAITDVVVMDLRGFSIRSRGCLYELQQIVTGLPTDRIVLISDQATNEMLLEETLQRAWTRAAGSRRATGPIALIRVERNSRLELDLVLDRLLGHGEPQQVRALLPLPA